MLSVSLILIALWGFAFPWSDVGLTYTANQVVAKDDWPNISACIYLTFYFIIITLIGENCRVMIFTKASVNFINFNIKN